MTTPRLSIDTAKMLSNHILAIARHATLIDLDQIDALIIECGRRDTIIPAWVDVWPFYPTNPRTEGDALKLFTAFRDFRAALEAFLPEEDR